jgi:hypothetical protein
MEKKAYLYIVLWYAYFMKCDVLYIWLRQTEQIHAHLWHKYSITVNHVMMATVKFSKLWLQLYC